MPPRKESSGVEEELRDLVWILVMVGSLVLVPPRKEGLGIGGSLGPVGVGVGEKL